MAIGEMYLSVWCRCGHQRMFQRSTDPELFELQFPESPNSYMLKDGVLDRLRCSQCGRRGRPEVRLGWSRPMGNPWLPTRPNK